MATMRPPVYRRRGTVSEAMRRGLPTVPSDTGVREALELLEREHTDCALVVDASEVGIGVVTLEVLLREHHAQGRDGTWQAWFSIEREPTVEEIMVPAWLSVDPDAPLHLAAALMAHERVGHLPVVAPDGVVVGAVSALDVLREIAARRGYAVGDRVQSWMSEGGFDDARRRSS